MARKDELLNQALAAGLDVNPRMTIPQLEELLAVPDPEAEGDPRPADGASASDEGDDESPDPPSGEDDGDDDSWDLLAPWASDFEPAPPSKRNKRNRRRHDPFAPRRNG